MSVRDRKAGFYHFTFIRVINPFGKWIKRAHPNKKQHKLGEGERKRTNQKKKWKRKLFIFVCRYDIFVFCAILIMVYQKHYLIVAILMVDSMAIESTLKLFLFIK